MKRNARIIQINGFSGILKLLFIVTCLAAGFIAFPGLVAMKLWNSVSVGILPSINLVQGVLLWGIVFLSYFIATKRHVSICFGSPKELDEEEMRILMERIKTQSRARMINQMMLKNLEEKEEKNSDSVTK